MKQFKKLPNTINALVFVAGPGSFVNLMAPHTMLGSMYGDFAFSIPVNVSTGAADRLGISPGFQLGEGRMLRSRGAQNTRISALISLHNYSTYASEAAAYVAQEDGRTREEKWNDIFSGVAGIQEDPTPCVTVWENAVSRNPFPKDLFTGPMDARWSANDGYQSLSFVGEKRKSLKIDGN